MNVPEVMAQNEQVKPKVAILMGTFNGQAINVQSVSMISIVVYHQMANFWEMMRALVVVAVGCEHREAVGMVVGAQPMVASGFGCIANVDGLVAVVLRKCGLRLGKIAIDILREVAWEAKGRRYPFVNKIFVTLIN